MMYFISASLAALSSAATAQTIHHYSDTLFCRDHLRGQPGRPWVLVTVEADKSHRPLRHSISMWGRNYRASWVYPDGRFRPDVPLEGLELSSIALERGAHFPVTATIRFDGRTVWSADMPRSTHTVITVPATRRESALPSRPGISVEVGIGLLPTLFGVTTAEVVVTAVDGAEVARQVLVLPDWASVESWVADAFMKLEGQRLAGRCRPDVSVTISD
jgi:hypothetical protein